MGREAEAATPTPVGLGQGTEMLETFLSLMPDAAIAVDANGVIVAVNVRTESFFGYSPGELEGKPVEILVPERYRHTHRSLRAGYSSAPRARPMGADLELFARRRDGTEFPVDISLAPIGEDDGSLIVAAIRDITERKASQAAQAQLAAIVQSSADAIFSMTKSGVVTSWNPGAESIFGHARADVDGRHISEFFPDDPVLEELIDAARNGHPLPAHDTCWRTHDGTPIDVALSVSLMGASEDAGYSVLARDIRARKAAEALLRRQARWQAATSEIRLSLLSEGPVDDSLELICKWAVELSGARAAALVTAEDARGRVAGQAGERAVLGLLPGVLEPVLERLGSEQPFAVAMPRGTVHGSEQSAESGEALEGRVFAIAFRGSDVYRAGALVVIGAARGDQASADVDESLTSLASQALLAFELDMVRSERDQLLISADRERIARDLHDLVIQRLFGAGLRLQGALGLIGNQVAATRVSSTIDDLDTTIKEIREAIFALESAPGTSLRAKVLEAVSDATELLGFKPSVSFQGTSEGEVTLGAQVEAVAVLREALSNAARHAKASRVEVRINVGEQLEVLVIDNGRGIGEPGRLSGIANARARAELLGGKLELSAPEGGGTSFSWSVPVSPA